MLQFGYMKKGNKNLIIYTYSGITSACTIGFALLLLQAQDRIETVEGTNLQLESALVTMDSELDNAESIIDNQTQELDDMRHRLNTTSTALDEQERENDRFARQIQNLTGTIQDLDRLSRIDRELLQKYSRTFFLNENYRPAQMTKVLDQWVLEGRQEQYFLTDAWPFLQDMLRSAERAGVDLRVVSAFRSFDEQAQLKDQFTQQFGAGANEFSADQGFSEHQLGTAVDFSIPGMNELTEQFSETNAYRWLEDNAHRYGFILSYPEGNEFYIYEPWHWRFVGRELAQDLHRENAYFYDWDQRRIDEYLIYLFD